MRILTLLFVSMLGLAPFTFGQNLIPNPDFNGVTSNSSFTGSIQEGASGAMWEFIAGTDHASVTVSDSTVTLQAGADQALIAVPFGDGNNGTTADAPIILNAGQEYTVSFYLTAGTIDVQEGGSTVTGGSFSFTGTPGSETLETVTFTGAGDSGGLDFSTDGTSGSGSFNMPTLVATPEPKALIFCSLLALGVCCVERKRLKGVLFPAAGR
jgi:hypothetical protein